MSAKRRSTFSKYATPAAKIKADSCKRQGDRSRGQRRAEKRRAKAVDHACHGIEIEQHPPFFRHQAGRVNHRRGEHPELQHERYDVAEITIGYGQSGKERAHAEGNEHHAEDQERRQQQAEAERPAIYRHEHEQDHGSDQEIGQTTADGRERYHQAREIDLCHEMG